MRWYDILLVLAGLLLAYSLVQFFEHRTEQQLTTHHKGEVKWR